MLNVLISARESGPWVVEIAAEESGGLLKIQKRGQRIAKKVERWMVGGGGGGGNLQL